MVKRLRAWIALLVLLAVVVGLPAALAATIGNPLSAWPDIKAGDMSDPAVLAILATVAWAAWATFAAAFAVEFVAALAAKLTGSAPRERRIPLLGFQQALVRTVLAAVFVLAPTVAGVLGPAAKAVASPAAHTAPSARVAAVSTQHTATATAAGHAAAPAAKAS